MYSKLLMEVENIANGKNWKLRELTSYLPLMSLTIGIAKTEELLDVEPFYTWHGKVK